MFHFPRPSVFLVHLDNRLEPISAFHFPCYCNCFKGLLVTIWGHLREELFISRLDMNAVQMPFLNLMRLGFKNLYQAHSSHQLDCLQHHQGEGGSY